MSEAASSSQSSAPPAAPNPEVPRVILVTPTGGGVSVGWRATMNGAVKDRSLVKVVKEARCDGSASLNNFNALLATALDARDRGEVTHLAMCHGDVSADPGWVDALWGEMWYNSAAVVSSVIPIKGFTGRTSTAVGLESDRWTVPRCVYVQDRETLPVTFGPESVCGPGEVLLVNNGLFLADLRYPFWDTYQWQFHGRIRQTEAGRVAEGRSEDWEWSHDMHAAGLRYMATWRVKLRHEGGCSFPNYPDAYMSWPPAKPESSSKESA